MNYGEFLNTIYDLLDLGQRKPEPMFEEIIAALKAKLARPAVDREELAKLLHRRGNSDVLWEDVSEAMRDHFRDMAGGFLASIGVSATGVNLEAANRELQVRLELQQDLTNAHKSNEARLMAQLEAREVELAKMRQALEAANNEIARLTAALDAAKKECDVVSTNFLQANDEAWREVRRLSGLLDVVKEEHSETEALLNAKGVLFEQVKMERNAAKADLASERKKWPELKADVERLKQESIDLRLKIARLLGKLQNTPLPKDELLAALEARLKELTHGYTDADKEVWRLRKLVRAHELTISLFGHIIKGEASPMAGTRCAETGETAHIAPDVREALRRLSEKAAVTDDLRVKLQAEMLRKPLPKLDRDRIRLALLDWGNNYVIAGSLLNDLADHLVKRLG